MLGSEAVAEVLRREDVEYVFCFPSNKLIDAVAALGIKPVVGREERSVINMADAYSRMHNGERIGVAMVQHGPGAEHSYGGIAQAYADSVPLLFLPSGNPRPRLGLRTTFDSVEAYRPVSKWAARFETPAGVPDQLRRAFQMLRSGRSGPVVLEMPQDVAAEDFPGEEFEYEPPRRHRSAADPADVAQAVRMLRAAERPLIHVGQGVLWSRATEELVEFADLVGAPVATTYTAKSAFPEDHPLSIGCGGTSISPGIEYFAPRADLFFSIGSSLITTLGSFPLPRGRTVVQSTNDPGDLSLEYPIAAAMVGDAKLVLAQVIDELRRQRGDAGMRWDARAEVAEVAARATAQWASLFESNSTPISPYRVVAEMIAAFDPAATVITHDSGYPRDHLAPHYPSTRPRGYLGWGNSTPLGSSLGLALGAKAASPQDLVVCFLGDAAFGQCGLEIETSVRNKLPVLIVLVNNSEMSGYEKLQPVAQQKYGIKHLGGNYAGIAEALGAQAIVVEAPGDLAPSLRKAIADVSGGQTVLVEVRTASEPYSLRVR